MGRVIEEVALERGHRISAKFSSSNPLNVAALEGTDIAIEFTKPHLAIEHMKICREAGCPVVVGTTGWYSDFETVKSEFLKSGVSMFYATNFSLGVNIVFHVNKILAEIMSTQIGYKAEIEEIHHTAKLDAPSGTAITLAEGILEKNANYTNWELATSISKPSVLPIHAVRENDVPGTHHVQYKSDIDSIILSHIAHNRKGFALGSVIAAEWLINQKGVFSMSDLLNFGAR